MKFLVLLLALQVGTETVVPRFPPPAAPETRNILRGLRLYRQTSGKLVPVGSACPTSPLVAYTAAHVVGDDVELFAHPDNGVGFDPALLIRVRVAKVDKDLDVARIIVTEGKTFPDWFPRADIPLPGAGVIGVLMLFDGVAVPNFGTYLGSIKDPKGFFYHLSTVLSSGGSSGSCALNAHGEAWGITLGGHLWGTDLSNPMAYTKATRHAAIPKKD